MPAPSTSTSLTAAYDWSTTDLGDPAGWPYGLRLTVEFVLAMPLPMMLDWSERHIVVYNDAYATLAGARHARSPGGRVPALRPPAVSANPQGFASAWAGSALQLAHQRLTFIGSGATSELVCDLHLNPVRAEDGAVCGVLCAVVPSAVPDTAAAQLRVLVVEDNLDSQYLVCEMLRAFGHEPEGTGHGEGALHLLADHQYDVLFTDVSLPGISGVEMARQALLIQPNLKVIFASGYGDALLRHVEFPYVSLQKPYELDQLQDALSSVAPAAAGQA